MTLDGFVDCSYDAIKIIVGMAPAVKITDEGVSTPVKFEGDKPTLKEMQEIVGGYIQIIPLTRDKSVVLNEEGKLNQLSVNEQATQLARQESALIEGDCIVGDCLVIDNKLLEDDADEEDGEG